MAGTWSFHGQKTWHFQKNVGLPIVVSTKYQGFPVDLPRFRSWQRKLKKTPFHRF